MIIVFPSDPSAQAAHTFLNEHGIENDLRPIDETLNYQNDSTQCVYVDHAVYDSAKLMRDLSGAGIVIMRVFKDV